MVSDMERTGGDLKTQALLREILGSQRFAVLATDERGQPFTSLMAFAVADDLGKVLVLTERTTRKFANLKRNARVALLIDNRENKDSDTQDSIAVTLIGEAQEINPDADAALLDLYLARHPYLAAFAASPSCAMVRVKIDSYLLVSRFEKVLEWCPVS